MNIWNWNWIFTSSTWNFLWNFLVTILVSWTKSSKIEGLHLFSTNESSSPVILLKMNFFLCNYQEILLPKTFCIGLKELCCRTTFQKQPFADVLQNRCSSKFILWILQNIKNTFFLQNTFGGYFWLLLTLTRSYGFTNICKYLRWRGLQK